MNVSQRETVLTYWNSSADGLNETLKNASYVLWYASAQFGEYLHRLSAYDIVDIYLSSTLSNIQYPNYYW